MRARWLVLVVALAACASGEPVLDLPTSLPATTTTTRATTTTTTTVVATTTTSSTTLPPTTQTSSTTTTAPVSDDLALDTIVSLTLQDLDDYWGFVLEDAYGVEYVTVADVIPYFPSQPVTVPPCGGEDPPLDVVADNAYYCPPDDYVAWDAEGLFPDLYATFGDFVIALVLAHEWGHAVQERAAVFGPTIMTELQADCFAGAWTGDVDAGNSPFLQLSPGDLDEAMGGYLLFRDPPGTPSSDPGAHGSAFDRINAFAQGFTEGAAHCAQYEDGNYSVVDIPITVDDIETGGDLPLGETIPLIAADLEAWWEITFPEVLGEPWQPLGGLFPYDPDGSIPECPGVTEYRFNIFYCEQGDFIAWDDVNLIPFLWSEFGDFAVAVLFANEFGHAVQARADLDLATLLAELQADCLAGAWTATMVGPNGGTTGITLSAGDIDEGIAAMLDTSDARTQGSAFQRSDFFEDGFVGGVEACLG